MTSSRPVPAEEAAARPQGDLPRAFGRYTLFDHIGRGGMADIYLASRRDQLGGSRYVVIKQILPHLSADPAFAAMLTAEAKLAAKLGHANVVQVMDLGREADRLFIAMEYVEGFDLHQLLRHLSKARVPLPAEFAIFIVRGALRALDYAHRARDEEGRPLGLVHRDVSPSNVLISFEGEVKLCDFGIARAFKLPGDAPDEDAVAESRVAGKSAYMSPEHANGEDIDARADVFAAGILLWELSAGRRMYKGTEEEMLRMAQTAATGPVPSGRLPEQETLQGILDLALAPAPVDRFATAADFLRALEEYAMSVGLMASQLRFGSFLTDHFADEVIAGRRARERQASYYDERDPTGSSVRSIAERADDRDEVSESGSGAGSVPGASAAEIDEGDGPEPVAEGEGPPPTASEPATGMASPPLLSDAETGPLAVRKGAEPEAAPADAIPLISDAETGPLAVRKGAEAEAVPADAIHFEDTAQHPSVPPEKPRGVAVAFYVAVAIIALALALSVALVLR